MLVAMLISFVAIVIFMMRIIATTTVSISDGCGVGGFTALKSGQALPFTGETDRDVFLFCGAEVHRGHADSILTRHGCAGQTECRGTGPTHRVTELFVLDFALEELETDTELEREKDEYATGLSSAVYIMVETEGRMTMLPLYRPLAVEMEMITDLSDTEPSMIFRLRGGVPITMRPAVAQNRR